MYGVQEPQVNRWYTSLAGQLFKVKAYSMGQEGLSDVMIEYPDGKVQVINRYEWYCLKLSNSSSRI